MDERTAAAALRALADGEERKFDELCTWLSQHSDVEGRYLVGDLKAAARNAAVSRGDGGLNALLSQLANCPDSLLVAFFPAAEASEVFELPGARIGPAAELASYAPSERALEVWPAKGDTLAVLTRHPAQGRLGAIRTAAWLQTVLGAIGLAAYAHARSLAPVAICPMLGTAMFLTTATGVPGQADQVALLSAEPTSAARLADLVSSTDSRSVLLDATARAPSDLAQRRLTLAVRWLQLAASAVGTADAFIALGVALEIIAGDDRKGQVLERIAKRAAVFLASAAPTDERGDVYYDELKRAKRLYELRSRVAHGQYDEWAADPGKGDADRAEFHRFVLDVALGFRRHVRERNMRNSGDFDTWWKRMEIEGVFA